MSKTLETILVHECLATTFPPLVGQRLIEASVEIHADTTTMQYLGGTAQPATEADWSTEYLDLILAVKTVSGLDEAIAHINRYGSHHTDSIITKDRAAAERFQHEVDSAVVLHTASTRFNDGGEFGFGAEIFPRTNCMHADRWGWRSYPATSTLWIAAGRCGGEWCQTPRS